MQVVFRAMNQKDKVTLACKTMIRALNTKLTAHDMTLNQLSKLPKHCQDNYEKIKTLSSNFDHIN